MTEDPCDKTGLACEWIWCCNICNDTYCGQCYRFRDWEKEEMATCEEGVLIAEPGMKCDHDVELLDECKPCADGPVQTQIEMAVNEFFENSNGRPTVVRLSSDKHEQMIRELRAKVRLVAPVTENTTYTFAAQPGVLEIFEDASLPPGTIRVS